MVGNPCSKLYLLRTWLQNIKGKPVYKSEIAFASTEARANLIVKRVVEHVVELFFGQVRVSVQHLIALDLDNVRLNGSATKSDKLHKAKETTMQEAASSGSTCSSAWRRNS